MAWGYSKLGNWACVDDLRVRKRALFLSVDSKIIDGKLPALDRYRVKTSISTTSRCSLTLLSPINEIQKFGLAHPGTHTPLSRITLLQPESPSY
jgi:hypothetical protein